MIHPLMQQGPSPLPEKRYDLEIAMVERVNSAEGEYLSLAFKMIGGEHDGRTLCSMQTRVGEPFDRLAKSECLVTFVSRVLGTENHLDWPKRRVSAICLSNIVVLSTVSAILEDPHHDAPVSEEGDS